MSHLDGLILDIAPGERGRHRTTRDGREVYEEQITLTQAGWERLKQGYLCGRCMEDLRPTGAFPERCPCCGFRVRELQSRQLQQDYVGETSLGSKLSISDELARLSEMWFPGD